MDEDDDTQVYGDALTIAYQSGYHDGKKQRPWVDLTDKEIWREYQLLWPFHPEEEPKLAADMVTFARAVLAKSKERNA